MDSFEFEYGKVLENVNVEYVASGMPKYDDEGYITNALIFCSETLRENSVLKNAQSYIVNQSSFKEDDFFCIDISSLGTPDSCSPSSTGLKHKFPMYNMNDMIEFKRQFLAEKFKIKKILGLLGEGMGGYEVFSWACKYPEEMEFMLVLNSTYKTSGYRYVISKGFEAIIDSTDEFYSDVYDDSLSRIIVAINRFLFAQSLSEKMFSGLSNLELDSLMDDFVDEGLFMDIYDFKFRNDCIIDYDVEDELSNIKAKSLIIYSNESIFSERSNNIKSLNENLENVKILSFESQKEKYYDEEDYSIVGDEVISFLEDCLN
jgi:homoserine O-acetyltransferase